MIPLGFQVNRRTVGVRNQMNKSSQPLQTIMTNELKASTTESSRMLQSQHPSGARIPLSSAALYLEILKNEKRNFIFGKAQPLDAERELIEFWALLNYVRNWKHTLLFAKVDYKRARIWKVTKVTLISVSLLSCARAKKKKCFCWCRSSSSVVFSWVAFPKRADWAKFRLFRSFWSAAAADAADLGHLSD